MKILLTGHLGFIGTHIQKRLEKDGHKVVGMDKRSGSWREILKEDITLAQLDDKYDVIVNCAGEIFDRKNLILTNVVGVERMAEFAKESGTKLIHLSTNSIYGNSYYGLSKKMGEEIIQSINPDGWVILRLTSVFEKGGRGDSPACRFSRGEREILGDGLHIKDHIHVRDVANAVSMAITYSWAGIFNLSSGKPATVNEIYKRLGNGKPTYLPKKHPDMVVSTLDNSMTLERGWKPTWSIYDE